MFGSERMPGGPLHHHRRRHLPGPSRLWFEPPAASGRPRNLGRLSGDEAASCTLRFKLLLELLQGSKEVHPKSIDADR